MKVLISLVCLIAFLGCQNGPAVSDTVKECKDAGKVSWISFKQYPGDNHLNPMYETSVMLDSGKEVTLLGHFQLLSNTSVQECKQFGLSMLCTPNWCKYERQ
jgi:hypothetical protein